MEWLTLQSTNNWVPNNWSIKNQPMIIIGFNWQTEKDQHEKFNIWETLQKKVQEKFKVWQREEISLRASLYSQPPQYSVMVVR